MLSDKDWDSNALRVSIAKQGAEVVTPFSRVGKVTISHDDEFYEPRNRIERCFNRMKYFRCFTIRYDRCTKRYTPASPISPMP